MRILGAFGGSGARGSVNGLTFSMNRGQQVVRRKAIPVRRIRDVQPGNRSRLGFLSREWGMLTEANRELWRQWALDHPLPDGFGGTKLVTGQNWFTLINIQLMTSQATNNYSAAPPVANMSVGISTLVAEAGVAAGDITLNWTSYGGPVAGDKVAVDVAGPFASPGVFDTQGKYKNIFFVNGNLLTKVMTGFVELGWYWFRVRLIDASGQASAWLVVQFQALDTP